MDKFKHINFDINRRKLNSWKRRINSNSLNMGIIKKTKPIEEPVESIIPSEISSLCSDDNIFKLTNSKPSLQKDTLKVKTNPMLRLPKKTMIQKPQRQQKPQRPPSPLVFLDLNEFKNNNIIEKSSIEHQQIINEKAQHKTKINLKVGTPKTQQKPQSKILHKPQPIVKHTIKQPIIKQPIKKSIENNNNGEVYKIHTKITNKIKHGDKNNKKYLEEANHFSLEEIKQNLNNKSINITDKAPEHLIRNLYILCNINV